MAQSERYHPAAPGARLGELPRPLDGRVAIVTGAAGGLGAVIWPSLHAAGATVVPVDLHGDGCPIADVSTAAGNRQVALLLIPIPPRPARTGFA